VADFLDLFRVYILEQLRRELGPDKGHLTSRGNINWVLTVPAMWDARSKGAMRDAAIRAGFVRKEDPPEQLVIALVGLHYITRIVHASEPMSQFFSSREI